MAVDPLCEMHNARMHLRMHFIEKSQRILTLQQRKKNAFLRSIFLFLRPLCFYFALGRHDEFAVVFVLFFCRVGRERFIAIGNMKRELRSATSKLRAKILFHISRGARI